MQKSNQALVRALYACEWLVGLQNGRRDLYMQNWSDFGIRQHYPSSVAASSAFQTQLHSDTRLSALEEYLAARSR